MEINQKVSVVLATCNGARYLSAQVQSVLSQTYSNLELIISDDNSADETLDIVGGLAELDKRIRVFSNPKRLGVSGNFLKSLTYSQGGYVCFCDQDDIWRKDKIEVLIKRLRSHKDNLLVYSDLEVCDENLKVLYPSYWKVCGLSPLEGPVDERILLRNVVPGCSILFTEFIKNKMLRLSGDAPFVHDHLAMALSGGLGRVCYTGERLVQYRQHGANVIGIRQRSFDQADFMEQLGKRVTFFHKQYGDEILYDYQRLIRFRERQMRERDFFGPVTDFRYYRFMLPSGLKYGLQAGFKCIFPGIYRFLRKQFR